MKRAITKADRPEANAGAKAERRAMRVIIGNMARKGAISVDLAWELRAAIDAHIKRIAARPGGIGRK